MRRFWHRLSGLIPLVVVVAVMLSSTAQALPPDPGFNPPDVGGPPPFTPPAEGFDWSVPPRFGGNVDSRGLLDYHWNAASATYYSDYVHPTALPVQFNGCPTPTEAAGNGIYNCGRR